MVDISALRVVVVGLGYVGLPLAIQLARYFDVIGLDIDRVRLAELRRGHDRTAEIEKQTLVASALKLTEYPASCGGADLYIITVPTPIDDMKRPDLRAVESASRTVARLLDPALRPIIVYESTVYPGVTEEICGAILARDSGLVRGRDFFLGYSPERINPGDKDHRIDNIVKVVAGENDEVTERLAEVYGAVTSAGVFRAASIKAAEAAKVIENAQRDINIAFMNEIAQIFARLDLSVWDVLAAAGTKWNFLPFQPGLVGGHCIGIDPYYLSHRAQELGHDPQIILSGRATNDGMGTWVAEQIHERRGRVAGSVLVLGLTFKEDVPDLRNSRVIDVIRKLEALGHVLTIHDPRADPDEAAHEYGVRLDENALTKSYDIVFAAVPHFEYRGRDEAAVRALLSEGGMIADLKGMWRNLELDGLDRWTL